MQLVVLPSSEHGQTPLLRQSEREREIFGSGSGLPHLIQRRLNKTRGSRLTFACWDSATSFSCNRCYYQWLAATCFLARGAPWVSASTILNESETKSWPLSFCHLTSGVDLFWCLLQWHKQWRHWSAWWHLKRKCEMRLSHLSLFTLYTHF